MRMTDNNKYWQRLLEVQVKKNGDVIKFRADAVRKNRFEIHVSVPFSDNPTPCMSEVTIFNLSEKSVNLFEVGSEIVINAGYGGMDFGCLTEGRISELKPTQRIGDDRVTSFTVIEGKDYSKLKDVNITFNKGTDAKTIINRIALKSSIIYYELELKKNKVYDKGFTADGQPLQLIREVAEACETQVYFKRGKLVIKNFRDTKSKERLKLSYKNGLFESPERIENEDYKGWSCQSLLQHKISIGTPVSLETRTVKGSDFFVKNGTHVCDGSSFVTNFEVTT